MHSLEEDPLPAAVAAPASTTADNLMLPADSHRQEVLLLTPLWEVLRLDVVTQ